MWPSWNKTQSRLTVGTRIWDRHGTVLDGQSPVLFCQSVFICNCYKRGWSQNELNDEVVLLVYTTCFFLEAFASEMCQQHGINVFLCWSAPFSLMPNHANRRFLPQRHDLSRAQGSGYRGRKVFFGIFFFHTYLCLLIYRVSLFRH